MRTSSSRNLESVEHPSALASPTVAKDVVETAVKIHGNPQLRY